MSSQGLAGPELLGLKGFLIPHLSFEGRNDSMTRNQASCYFNNRGWWCLVEGRVNVISFGDVSRCLLR